jgi:hypothetical protein
MVKVGFQTKILLLSLQHLAEISENYDVPAAVQPRLCSLVR